MVFASLEPLPGARQRNSDATRILTFHFHIVTYFLTARRPKIRHFGGKPDDSLPRNAGGRSKAICRYLRSRGLSLLLVAKTRSRHFGYLNNAFTIATKANALAANPLEGLEPFRVKRKTKVEILTPEEMKAFYRPLTETGYRSSPFALLQGFAVKTCLDSIGPK